MQLLLVMPILFLWPLFAGRWSATVRVLTGFLLGAGLLLSPWVVLGNVPITQTAGSLRWIPSFRFSPPPPPPQSAFLHPLAMCCTGLTFPRLITAGCLLLGSIILTTLLLLRHWPAD